MKLSEVGERHLIELFSRHFSTDGCKEVIRGIGDDCAVFRLPGGKCLLVSTDTVVQTTHIPREMTPRQIGKYAVNVVLSDIAAMGGSPLGMVFSIALPPDFDEDFAKELVMGMESAAKVHGTCIVGGDTQESPEIVITGSAFGLVEEKNLLLRNGAEIGDLICVTGDIGSAAMGFYGLIKGLSCPESFIKKAIEPMARLKEGVLISKYANSCIDISDGLAWSVHEITSQSNVGSLLYEADIPIDSRLTEIAQLSDTATEEMVLYKGGDFELLFTVDSEGYGRLEKEFQGMELRISIIGRIIDTGNILACRSGEKKELEKRGWEAFKQDMF